MSEAVALGQFCSIGTDANIGVPAALVRYLYDPSVNNMASEQSANWDEKTYLEIAEGNKKTVTTGIYSEAMASMLNDVIKVCDVIRSEFFVGFSDGNKIFEAARDIISQGKHAIISFENVRSLSAAFLEAAIGQLYNGTIPVTKLEKHIIWRGVSPTRKLLIERAIAEAKESNARS